MPQQVAADQMLAQLFFGGIGVERVEQTLALVRGQERLPQRPLLGRVGGVAGEDAVRIRRAERGGLLIGRDRYGKAILFGLNVGGQEPGFGDSRVAERFEYFKRPGRRWFNLPADIEP